MVWRWAFLSMWVSLLNHPNRVCNLFLFDERLLWNFFSCFPRSSFLRGSLLSLFINSCCKHCEVIKSWQCTFCSFSLFLPAFTGCFYSMLLDILSHTFLLWERDVVENWGEKQIRRRESCRHLNSIVFLSCVVVHHSGCFATFLKVSSFSKHLTVDTSHLSDSTEKILNNESVGNLEKHPVLFSWPIILDHLCHRLSVTKPRKH